MSAALAWGHAHPVVAGASLYLACAAAGLLLMFAGASNDHQEPL